MRFWRSKQQPRGDRLEDYCGPNCPVRDRTLPGGSDAEAQQSIRQAHLVGHLLNRRAVEGNAGMTGIPQDGIEQELRYVFNELTNNALNEARRSNPHVTAEDNPAYQGVGPEAWGCFGEEARSELMAEAIRAYLQDPNSLKTMAPNVAKRIREWVNVHPELSRMIQFN